MTSAIRIYFWKNQLPICRLDYDTSLCETLQSSETNDDDSNIDNNDDIASQQEEETRVI